MLSIWLSRSLTFKSTTEPGENSVDIERSWVDWAECESFAVGTAQTHFLFMFLCFLFNGCNKPLDSLPKARMASYTFDPKWPWNPQRVPFSLMHMSFEKKHSYIKTNASMFSFHQVKYPFSLSVKRKTKLHTDFPTRHQWWCSSQAQESLKSENFAERCAHLAFERYFASCGAHALSARGQARPVKMGEYKSWEFWGDQWVHNFNLYLLSWLLSLTHVSDKRHVY